MIIAYSTSENCCTIETVDEFTRRYRALNPAQKQAVDHIDGPLLVIAGPGTGKTELLSMRVANILKKTDTLAENILCLTFTDSGANAMRARLAGIIGPEAYKVSIHTFHSFGTEVINQNNQYFYHGADFKPADELSRFEILREIFDELDYTSPLASKNNGEYVHLGDAIRTISELKQAGLTSDELLGLLDANDIVLDSVEVDLTDIFSGKISTKMLDLLVPLAERVAAIPRPALPPAMTPLSNVLALSMAHAFDEAVTSGKTNAITAWRNLWLEKDTDGKFVFKDRKRHAKLRATAHIYFAYLSRLEQAGLYDYDDMILNVIHGMETQPDLKYNLQEKYHYVLVDEFQDTNLAQLRILFDLMEGVSEDDAPNIMAVGDDDQAIYSFQGADVNNIHRFRDQFPATEFIVLTDNYRSSHEILLSSRELIVQGEDRLETTIESIDKQLVAHMTPPQARVTLHSLAVKDDEKMWLAETIRNQLDDGIDGSDIAVIARTHRELTELLPYLHQQKILVNYERRDNVLELAPLVAVEIVASVIHAIHAGHHDIANATLPELAAHPAFEYSSESIWKLSLSSYQNHTQWLESMATSKEFQPLQLWLIDMAKRAATEPLERMLDAIIGIGDESAQTEALFRSPLYEYYFGENARTSDPETYLVYLDGMRTIRSKLREYRPNSELLLEDFMEFIDLHRQMNAPITTVRRRADDLKDSVNLMTAHKSKGLEFDHVYIINAIDSAWGERVRSRNRLISYPENLQIAPSGGNINERLRLFYVAMTRAKVTLTISYASSDERGRDQLAASFLTGLSNKPTPEKSSSDLASRILQSELDWRGAVVDLPQDTMQHLLKSQLETYKLSATHLNNFLDVTRGGPTHFLLSNLLHFPQAKSANASYGTAVHSTLHRAHTHLTTTGKRRPIEDILGDFASELKAQHLTDAEYQLFSKKGVDSLTKFLDSKYESFAESQKSELSFAGQGVVVDDAKLTGSLDLIDVRDGQITVTDYKTGSPSRDWKGKTDFEKIKLHKYRQQLMFYQLLVENSREYSKYTFEGGVLQFVEPDRTGTIHALDDHFSSEDMARFRSLVQGVWRSIMALDFPDIAQYGESYKDILAFEQDIIDKYS